MKDPTTKALKTRNLDFWMVAAPLYPIAHWIPTSSGLSPRIFGVLIPMAIFGLAFASSLKIEAALKAILELAHRSKRAPALLGLFAPLCQPRFDGYVCF